MCVILYKQIISRALSITAGEKALFLRGLHNLQGKVAIPCYRLLINQSWSL